MAGTVLPQPTSEDFGNRLLANFPAQWIGGSAASVGGILYSLFQAIGAELNYQGGAIQYAQDATRIATATDTELDYVSEDFFGDTMPRNPGETDTSFRARIVAGLFAPAVTRPAIYQALLKLTGEAPRLVEPWCPSDTGVWDGPGLFWDVDNAQAPFRWTDPSLAYQGFVDTIPTPLPTLGGPFLNTWDVGFFYDTGYGAYLDTPSQLPTVATPVDQLLNRIRAFGTIIWRRFSPPTLAAGTSAQGSVTVTAGAGSINVSVSPGFALAPAVITQASWQTTVSALATSGSNLRLGFGTAAPAGVDTVDWYADTLDQQQILLIAPFATQLTGTPPAGLTPFATADWATSVFQSAPDTLEFSASAPATGGSINVIYRTGLSVAIPQGATTMNVPVSKIGAYQVFILPNWNTSVAVTAKTAGQFTLAFSSPAPASASLLYYIP